MDFPFLSDTITVSKDKVLRMTSNWLLSLQMNKWYPGKPALHIVGYLPTNLSSDHHPFFILFIVKTWKKPWMATRLISPGASQSLNTGILRDSSLCL